MLRFLWSQLRFRGGRAATLGLGILVAVVSFTLLTAAARTSELRVRGTVAKNWRAAYDILVRPRNSFARLEKSESLVRQNYLSGIFGGITMRQYRSIQAVAGVDVAAPVANLGYVSFYSPIPITINGLLTDEPVQLYRLKGAWVADRGTSHYEASTKYVYYTRRHPLVSHHGDDPVEILTPRSRLRVCAGFNQSLQREDPRTPFDRSERSTARLGCFSSLSPRVAAATQLAPGAVGGREVAELPFLLAAIEPAAENRLLGLDKTLTRGRAVRASDRPTPMPFGYFKTLGIPVMASTKTLVDESLQVDIERLDVPAETNVPGVLASERAFRFLTSLSGERVGMRTFRVGPSYKRALARLSLRSGAGTQAISTYRTSSPVRYRPRGSDRLAAVEVSNPQSVWQDPAFGRFAPAPPGNEDLQFRRLATHEAPGTPMAPGTINEPALRVVGYFDPDRLPGFSTLSRVPLESYYPPRAEPADDTSKKALAGRPLLPSMNIGGYIGQPPLLFTNLRSARVLTRHFSGANANAPISVVRVRVAGVSGPDPQSRERVRRVAQAIVETTGLAVDITAGSSPAPVVVQLPRGKYGRPALALQEGWVKKGVAVSFLNAVNKKSVALFALVLVICIFFLVNGALASVRARRAEIGTLRCLGWSERAIFAAVVGEVALVGLLAGFLGTALAAILVSVLSLDMPYARAFVAIPLAVVLAILGGLAPAWWAARSVPLDAVRPPVSDAGSTFGLHGLIGMAVSDLRRLPARTMLGAVGLFVGVAALSVMLSLNLAFQGVLGDTLLGEFISVQVRGVDYLSVGLAMVLGGLSVADVLILNLRERAPEFVTLHAAGWRQRHLARVVSLEGVGIGLLGSATGALMGFLVGGLLLEGPLARVAGLSALAALAGVLVAVVASLVPAWFAGRTIAPHLLAEE